MYVYVYVEQLFAKQIATTMHGCKLDFYVQAICY